MASIEKANHKFQSVAEFETGMFFIITNTREEISLVSFRSTDELLWNARIGVRTKWNHSKFESKFSSLPLKTGIDAYEIEKIEENAKTLPNSRVAKSRQETEDQSGDAFPSYWEESEHE